MRVHVIEARRLFGNNLKPVVKVTCGQSIKQTSVRKGTNRPYWDEVSIASTQQWILRTLKSAQTSGRTCMHIIHMHIMNMHIIHSHSILVCMTLW